MLCVVLIQLFQSTAGFIIPSFLLSSRQQQNGKDLKLLFNNRIFAGSSYGFLSQPRPTHCSRIFSETSGNVLCIINYQHMLLFYCYLKLLAWQSGVEIFVILVAVVAGFISIFYTMYVCMADTGRLSDAEDLRAKLKGTCLFLVGMMGSGKTTVGWNHLHQLNV